MVPLVGCLVIPSLACCVAQEEIESCERLIRERAAQLPPDPRRPALLVLPIYAALPPEQQLKVFQPAPEGTRKASCPPSTTWLPFGWG